MKDGLLCRNDKDCTWLFAGLHCIDDKIDRSVSRDWFNGDSARIVGICDCHVGFWFEESRLSCTKISDSDFSGEATLIVIGVITVVACICCCKCCKD